MTQKPSIYELYVFNDLEATGTIPELAEHMDMTKIQIRNRVYKEIMGVRVKKLRQNLSEYALYRSDDPPLIGTMADLSEWTGIKQSSLRWYGSPAAQKRGNIVLIKLEDEDMIEKRTHDKHANVPEDLKYGPKETEKIYISRPAEMKPFKFESKWINYQLDTMFKNWSDVK